MRLHSVHIQNFCSCIDLQLTLNPFNPIIGYNNSGKSNILRAVCWLLKKSVLPEESFNDPAEPVIIEGLITDVQLSLLPENQRGQVEKYLIGNALRFRRRQDIPNCSARDVLIEVYDAHANRWAKNPTGLDNAISVLFPDPLYIEAMDDAADDVGKYAARNTIGLLLKYTVEQIRANNAAALQAAITDINTLGLHLNGPTRINELTALESEASKEVSEFFPGLGLHLQIQAPSIEDLIKGASISLSDGHGHQKPFSCFGHGSQRTVQMALIKLLASHLSNKNAQGAVTVLMIDEPELYLHPQAIERLRESLETLSKGNFQIIFSTHSPLMIGSNNTLNTLIAHKCTAGGTILREKLSVAADRFQHHEHHANVIFSLQHATYLLFSEGVVVVEGKTEKMLIPEIYKASTRRTMAQDGYCFIEGSGSAAIGPMMSILESVGFRPKAMADLDHLFKNGPSHGILCRSNPAYVSCYEWFQANHTKHGFYLGEDGFPSKRDSKGNLSPVKPEHAFALMAKENAEDIAHLAEIASARGIWVWQKGAIEEHLGIEKNDKARLGFLAEAAATSDLAHAADPDDLHRFAAWLQRAS